MVGAAGGVRRRSEEGAAGETASSEGGVRRDERVAEANQAVKAAQAVNDTSETSGRRTKHDGQVCARCRNGQEGSGRAVRSVREPAGIATMEDG